MAATGSRTQPIFYDASEEPVNRQAPIAPHAQIQHDRTLREQTFAQAPELLRSAARPQNAGQDTLPVRSESDQNACDAPPPAYSITDPAMPQVSNEARQLGPVLNEAPSNVSSRYRDDGQLPLPIVLPQTTKSFRGAFYSPFLRAYAPELKQHDISESDFLTVLDGLNECWVANPVFQGLGLAGGIMQQFYGVHIVQWVGIGVQTAAGVGSAATSFARTRAFVKAVNADLFHPAGLQLHVRKTKDMMQDVGHGAERLELPPLEDEDDLDRTAVSEAASTDNIQISQNDVRMRRIRALEGYVMPLNFDVPEAGSPDNLLKKMGNAQAKRLAKKQQKKDDKRLEKTISKEEKRQEDLEKDEKDFDKEIRKIDREWEKKHREMTREMQKGKAQRDEKERRKIEKDWEKEQKKLEKEKDKEIRKRDKRLAKRERKAEKKTGKASKEEKHTQKIRWLVITRWSGEEDSDDSTLDGDSLEDEHSPDERR
ncbi:hypothetical protein HII31_05509 [Pseudocercospora fuligena]|uniref:Uncharacterized protein n=1 Tax=Pseudocercospora fuligena TaxID=685502 RepID=A0A8H6VIS6_9PEZI|nr:hypothetical protein HII31_05509 [Pseudocercospora fuligena]